jgi:hypothetical protein
MRNCVCASLLLQARLAHQVRRPGIVGSKMLCDCIMLHRFIKLSQFEERRPQIQMRQRRFPVQAQCFAIMCHRLLFLARGCQEIRDVVMRLGAPGIDSQRLAVLRKRFVCLAGLLERDAKVETSDSILLRHGYGVSEQRFCCLANTPIDATLPRGTPKESSP